MGVRVMKSDTKKQNQQFSITGMRQHELKIRKKFSHNNDALIIDILCS